MEFQVASVTSAWVVPFWLGVAFFVVGVMLGRWAVATLLTTILGFIVSVGLAGYIDWHAFFCGTQSFDKSFVALGAIAGIWVGLLATSSYVERAGHLHYGQLTKQKDAETERATRAMNRAAELLWVMKAMREVLCQMRERLGKSRRDAPQDTEVRLQALNDALDPKMQILLLMGTIANYVARHLEESPNCECTLFLIGADDVLRICYKTDAIGGAETRVDIFTEEEYQVFFNVKSKPETLAVHAFRQNDATPIFVPDITSPPPGIPFHRFDGARDQMRSACAVPLPICRHRDATRAGVLCITTKVSGTLDKKKMPTLERLCTEVVERIGTEVEKIFLLDSFQQRA